jgi:hypothetical protein
MSLDLGQFTPDSCYFLLIFCLQLANLSGGGIIFGRTLCFQLIDNLIQPIYFRFKLSYLGFVFLLGNFSLLELELDLVTLTL